MKISLKFFSLFHFNFILFFFLLIKSQISYAKFFEIYIDLNPPYSTSVHTKKGLFSEIIDEALTAGNIPHHFLLKGDRIKNYNIHNENRLLLFYYFRTPERENNYNWIIPLFDDYTCLFNLRTSKEISSINALKGLSRIGTINGGAGESILKSFGLEGQIYYCRDEDSCIDRLRKNEVDAWITQKIKANYFLKKYKIQSELNNYFQIYDSQGWLASSLNLTQTDIDLLRKTLRKFMATSKFLAILKKYDAIMTSNSDEFKDIYQ
ncbi:substrate-binding periplasmic protein [Pigmentibacter ruber]|uniref:substrate-binding periplasmic protein n=1 Tax=Pigmentibacter ruber TaxID=2683196 RepID=UPI00131B6A25|nr:transporter substrate-binding domain-containing protein [Pigmentibacter ruber]